MGSRNWGDSSKAENVSETREMSDLLRVPGGNSAGEAELSEELLTLVYRELRLVAARRMAREAPGQTLQATALVHEAWLRLGPAEDRRWANRAHFFAAAGEAMRRILIEKARRRQRLRHGAGQQRVELDDLEIAAPESDERLLQVHEALDRLAAEDSTKADVVKLRFFAGFTDREVAEALGLSERTIERHWAYAKAWLFRAIQGQESGPR